MSSTLFEYEFFALVESYTLVLISIGLLGIRYFFHDYNHHIQKYKFIHIFALMLFTIYALELLIVMIAFFLYYLDFVEFSQMTVIKIKMYIFLPRLLFYSVLCYFIYWILKLFQTNNDEKRVKESLMKNLMNHPSFETTYLKYQILYKDAILWDGVQSVENEKNIKEVQIDEFKIRIPLN